MQNNIDPQESFRVYKLIACVLGAALGWFLAPDSYQRLGLGIGTGIGMLLESVWERWLLKRYPTATSSSRRWEHALYLIGVCLCVYPIWTAAITWIRYPNMWLASLASFLFFGAGAVILFTLWVSNRRFSWSIDIVSKRDLVLGLSAFVLASAGVFVILLGNIVIGLLGTLFFFWCGVVLIKKVRSGGRGLG